MHMEPITTYLLLYKNETALGPDETRIIKGVCPDGWHIPSQKRMAKNYLNMY